MRLLLVFVLLLAVPALPAQVLSDLPPDGAERSLYVAFQKGDLMAAITEVDWRPGLCMAVAPLSVGGSASLRVSLAANVSYTFLAATGSAATDSDLYVRGPDGSLLGRDEETDGTPVVTFTTQQAGNHTVTVRLVGGQEPQHFVALSMLRENGTSLLRAAYQRVAVPFFGAAAELALTSREPRWLAGAGTWCVYGFSLQPDRGAGLVGVRTGAGKIILAGRAAAEIPNVSLYLAERARIVASTNRKRNTPLLRYDNADGLPLDLRIDTDRQRAPGLFLLGVFQE